MGGLQYQCRQEPCGPYPKQNRHNPKFDTLFYSRQWQYVYTLIPNIPVKLLKSATRILRTNEKRDPSIYQSSLFKAVKCCVFKIHTQTTMLEINLYPISNHPMTAQNDRSKYYGIA